ncbi:hypothetical protein [Pseudonocardia spinosispora]|uniref:hypothetical protein n=1 Tax=Pseudonocardia spinosispora TaxID=103441 RepID=UPI0012EB30AA|nr:hypothetical protein [Pseudonocardia spinosispora]
MSEPRSNIGAATAAALWALSNGTCYAPGCPFPVVYEVRPGVYRKNVQIAHIIGVKVGAARHRNIPARERESFSNLVLLCLPHHAEVDDKLTGEEYYSIEKLRGWKLEREGANSKILGNLLVSDESRLFDALTKLFEPPIEKLERLAEQLQETGQLNAESLAELQQVVLVLRDSPLSPDASVATNLMNAAEVFSGLHLENAASQLMNAAEMMLAAQQNGY